MGMPIVIRPMSPSDFQPLAGWMVELPLLLRYGVTTEKAISGFETAVERGDWIIVAELESLPCGFAWAIPGGAFGRSPYLRLIGVRADMTGTGIGAALLDEIERMAADVAGDLFLLVSDFNEGGQRFYARRGYSQIGAIPGYVLPDVTELIFRKRLK
jgi:GNAT superfamily N-acetyltransferase